MNEDLNQLAKDNPSPFVSFLSSIKIEKIDNILEDKSKWKVLSNFDVVNPQSSGLGQSRLMGLHITESMFTPFVSGHIDVLDKHDWIAQMNLNGSEKITIEFSFIDVEENLKLEFFVFSSRIINDFAEVNSPKIETGEKATIYRLEFISDEIFNANFNKSILELDKDFVGLIAKGSEGGGGQGESESGNSVPGLIETIASKLKLQPIEIEGTKNGIWLKSDEITYPSGIQQGQLNVATLMSYVTNNAVPKENTKAPNFFFWKDRDGWHFKSVEKILKDSEESDEIVSFAMNSDDLQNKYRILSVEVDKLSDNLSLFQDSAFMSHYIRMEPNYENLYSDFLSSKSGFTYSIVDYDYHRDFASVRHVEKYKLLPDQVKTNPVKILSENNKKIPMPSTRLGDNTFGYYSTKIINTPFDYNINYSSDNGFGMKPDNPAHIWWDYLDRERDSRWSNVTWQPQFDITELEIQKLHKIYTKIRQPLEEKRKEFVKLKNLKREWEVYRCVVCCATNSLGSTADIKFFNDPSGITNAEEYNFLFGKNGILSGSEEYKIVAAGSFTDTINYDSDYSEIQNGLTLSINLENPNILIPTTINQEDYKPNEWYKSSIGQFFNLNSDINNYFNTVLNRGLNQYELEIETLTNKLNAAKEFVEKVPNFIAKANEWIESRLLDCCNAEDPPSEPQQYSIGPIDDIDYSGICTVLPYPGSQINLNLNLNSIYNFDYVTVDPNGLNFNRFFPATGKCSVENWGYQSPSRFTSTSPVVTDDGINVWPKYFGYYAYIGPGTFESLPYSLGNVLTDWIEHIDDNLLVYTETGEGNTYSFENCSKNNQDYSVIVSSDQLLYSPNQWSLSSLNLTSQWSNSKYNGLNLPEYRSEEIGNAKGNITPRRCTGSALRNNLLFYGFGDISFTPCGQTTGKVNPGLPARLREYIFGNDNEIQNFSFPAGGFYCYGDPRIEENKDANSNNWFPYTQNWCSDCPWQTSNEENENSQCYKVTRWLPDYYGVSGPSAENFFWENYRKTLEEKINQDTQNSCGRYILRPFSIIDLYTDISVDNPSVFSFLPTYTPLGTCYFTRTTELLGGESPGPVEEGPCKSPSYGNFTSFMPCADPDNDGVLGTWNAPRTIMSSVGIWWAGTDTKTTCYDCGFAGGLWLPSFILEKELTQDDQISICRPGGSACLQKGCSDPFTGSVFSKEPAACIGYNYIDGLGEIPLVVLPPGKCLKCNNFLETEEDIKFDKSNCCNCSEEQEKTFVDYKTDAKLEWCRECSKNTFVKSLPQYIGTEDNWYNNYGFISGGGDAFTDLDGYIGLNGNLQSTQRCIEEDNCYNKLCFNPLYLEAEGRRAEQEIKILEAQIKLLQYTKNLAQNGIITKFKTAYDEWWNRKAFFYSKMPGSNVFTDLSTGITGSISGGRLTEIQSNLSLFNIKSIKKKSIRGSRYELLAKNKGVTGSDIGEWLYNFAWDVPAQNQPITQVTNKHPYYSQKYQSPFISQRQLFKNYNYFNYNKFNDFPFSKYGEQPYSPDENKCFTLVNSETEILSLPVTQVSEVLQEFELELNPLIPHTQLDLINVSEINYHNSFNIFKIDDTTIPANLKKEQLSTYIRIEFESPIGLDRIVDFPDGFVRDAGTEYFLPYLISLTAGPTGRQTIRNNVVVIGMDPYGFDVAVKKSRISDEETDKQYHWWEEYRNLNDTSLTNNGMDLWPEVGFETSYPYYASDPKGWWWKSPWYHGEGTPDLSLTNNNNYDIFSRSADVDPEYKESAHGSGYLQYSYRRIKPHRSWWSFHIPKNIFVPQKLFPVLAKKFGSLTGESTGVIGDIYAYKYQDYYWWYGDDLDRWLRITKEGKELAENIKMLSVNSAENFQDPNEPLSNYAHVHPDNSLQLVGGAVQKYFYETTMHWLRGDFIMYKPGLLTKDVWKYDITGETDYGLVSPKTMSPNYDVFDDNFSAQFIVFSRETQNICKSFTCANPKGVISNNNCPENDPYCNCPAKDKMPKEKEPSYIELYRKYKEIKECELITKNLGPEYLGCIWSDPANPCSCNCPEIGSKFIEYLKYTRTYSTFWDTPRATPLLRKALLSQLGSQQISVKVPATGKIKVGDVININHYGAINLSFERQEKNLHGRWLVAEIVNSFYKDSNQTMRMTLIRDSLSVKPDFTSNLINNMLKTMSNVGSFLI